jgi:hypothetical protein
MPRKTRETANRDPLTRGVILFVMRRRARRRHIPGNTYPAVLLPIVSECGVDVLEYDP